MGFSTYNRTYYKQTVTILIRRCIMWHLIGVNTVWRFLIEMMLCLYGLKSLDPDYMGLDARKPVFGGLRTTSDAQADQSLCYSLYGEYNV